MNAAQQQDAHLWFEQLPPEWQQWLSNNIERGCSVDDLVQTLKQYGFSAQQQDLVPDEALSSEEIWHHDIKQKVIEFKLQGLSFADCYQQLKQTFSRLPRACEIQRYFVTLEQDAVYQLLKNSQHQLKKREWLLATLDDLARLDSDYSTHIPRLPAPDFQTFVTQFYSQNRPAILTDGINHWQAFKKWSPEYFAQHYGDADIEVQMHREQDQQFERHSPRLKTKMLMRNFVDKIHAVDSSNDFYMTANNSAQHDQTLMSDIFQDVGDFATGYCDLTQQNQLSFLWMGPKGTFTPLHHDLTNNMLVQIYGRKKVTLIPALQVSSMYNDHWVFSELSSVDTVDVQRYPLAKKLTPITCILEAGEALFIPIGWWHSVESLEASISVSFTHFQTKNDFFQNFPHETAT